MGAFRGRITAFVCSFTAAFATVAVAAEQPAPVPKLAATASPPDPQPVAVPQDTLTALNKLASLKWSGFVQGRAEWHQDSAPGLDAQGKPTEQRYFRVRTARLKVAHSGTYSEMVLQVEAAGDSVTLRDAEATFVDAWTPAHLRLTVGQFTWPFGHELQQSPADFVLPERSLVIRKLFPGERDRGVRLQARYRWLRFTGAVVNGNGIQDPIYKQYDQNSFKDLVGRLGGEVEGWSFGVSGYWGRARRTTLATEAKLGGTDRNGDGVVSGTEITYTPATSTTYDRFWTYRLGADVQAQRSLGRIGRLTVKGEFVWARDVNAGSGSVPADASKDKTSWGWYVQAVCDIRDRLGVALRVDQFDPGAFKSTAPSTTDRVTTVGGSLLGYISPELKLLLAYEHVMEQQVSVGNDVLTAQLQARF